MTKANSETLIDRVSALILNPVTAIVATLACTGFLYALEQAVKHMPFVMLSVLGIATLLFLLSRRIYFSIYTALVVTTLISISSVLKYRTKGFDLHIYDFVFTGTDPKAFAFLLDGFAAYIVPIAGLMLCSLIVLSLIFIWDGKNGMTVLKRGSLVVITFALIPVSYPLAEDEPRYFHYLGGFNASAFFVSFLDLRDAAIGRGIADRFTDMPAVAPFASAGPCETTGPKPDLFVVLSESQTDLSRLNQYGIDQQFSQQFKSADGKHRALRVETFGGGTWISNFSLMTGLSSLDFGWRAPYLTTAMEGKIHQSLATELSRCGYRTAVLMPMDHGFVNEGPFLESIGFDEVLDFNRIGATQYAHHDRFYFEAARAFIEEHRKTDGRPLFLEVQTMFAHSPYSDHLADSDSEISGESGIFELDEYVRRVAQSQKDFEWYLGQAEAESKDHPSIVLEFGDHQSFATRELVHHLYPDFAIDELTSSAYQTYYTVHGMGIELDMGPFDYANLDIGYLGVSLLEAAGMAKSPMFADLAALRDRCEGKLHFCADRAAVDRHLQKRIASNFLSVE
ncbi:Sulfatase [Hoeflea sp. IMCC20628]|uniref:sulfatase-like hydrolase/transferase n=1 Tax=Hoeflea sp. IMCC20628 TaxID=1620421 RepID=UPI00063BF6A6|nr:sulfatase-like hydrolase/transferase [Hoeflea sp. IMCC20628]AKI01902.1 Sulfatase [Hoeflea sp. IMCC20628]